MKLTDEERRSRRRAAGRKWYEKNKERRKVYAAAWRATNAESRRAHARASYDPAKAGHKARLRKYGVTPEWFDETLLAQGGACALCRTPYPGGRGTWHVDHEHRTGRVRGLLCVSCNIGLASVDRVGLPAVQLYLSCPNLTSEE